MTEASVAREKLLLAVYADQRFVQLELEVTLANSTLSWSRDPIVVEDVAASTPDATKLSSAIQVLVKLTWPESYRFPVGSEPTCRRYLQPPRGSDNGKVFIEQVVEDLDADTNGDGQTEGSRDSNVTAGLERRKIDRRVGEGEATAKQESTLSVDFEGGRGIKLDIWSNAQEGSRAEIRNTLLEESGFEGFAESNIGIDTEGGADLKVSVNINGTSDTAVNTEDVDRVRRSVFRVVASKVVNKQLLTPGASMVVHERVQTGLNFVNDGLGGGRHVIVGNNSSSLNVVDDGNRISGNGLGDRDNNGCDLSSDRFNSTSHVGNNRNNSRRTSLG
ncbi:uncharacterized protein N7482_004998 [Penicillium canariense]|uniref:Uncharacterized protein n=1 Tax=Penicillium canariense TaxID=189055 RepID=A0A9W9I754_9EURO|nr:uncharacterized protein N7482_004998 [Penicillium canariense]KAJ5166217.1 hypothetical protein N7482_004998 [Penicillium canariense]